MFKKWFVVFFVFFLALSLTAIFSYAASDENGADAESDVTIITVTQAGKEVTYQLDEKGGIIVPNASKGVQQKTLTPEQQKKLNALKKAMSPKSTSTAVPVEKDFSASRK